MRSSGIQVLLSGLISGRQEDSLEALVLAFARRRDDGTELRTGARAKPPGNPSAWPIRARSGIPHASWDGQVPIPAEIRIGLLVASVHLSSLPSALVSVSPRSARPAALGYTSADTVPAPRQNDRVHSAPVPAHTWRSARPTVKRRLDRARAPSAAQLQVSRQLLVRRTAQWVRAPGRRMPLCVHARISHDWHGY